MPKKIIKKKAKNTKAIELAKETKTSVIAVSREYQLNLDIITPKTVDETYAVVPEASRSLDLRAAAMVYRGYEIEANGDSEDAKRFANICYHIIEKSGGVNWVEQFSKNADGYGNGYEELVKDGNVITELAHVHSQNFGYELEVYDDPVDFKKKTRVKLDKDTQKPVGFASYKYDDLNEIYINDKTIPCESIAHLKYKVLGDALYGISLFQPMYGSILRKLKIENSIEAAARLVAAPKIVISGDFADDAEAKEQAREAASLDVNDVILLQNEKEFKFVNPGQTSLPELREIFVVNITTASGIPRPLLTSQSAEINKATMQTLMTSLRENMRSNMVKMKNIIEQKIFYEIGKSYGITDFESIIPRFIFPEDVETEQEIIIREERKAATLTSLSNSLMLMNNMLMGTKSTPPNAEMKTELTDSMKGMFETLNETIRTFAVNNDQDTSKIEEELPEELIGKSDSAPIKLDIYEEEVQVEHVAGETADSVEDYSALINVSLTDDITRLQEPDYIFARHDLTHRLYDALIKGASIYDADTKRQLTILAVAAKHKFYVLQMQNIGMIHDLSEIGSELDEGFFE